MTAGSVTLATRGPLRLAKGRTGNRRMLRHATTVWSRSVYSRATSFATAIVLAALVLGGCGPGGGSKNLTGTFLRWQPVDSANGYAYFTVTNNGASTAVAKCTVNVRDDFGDFGFDTLVGETVPAGQTVTLKMAIGMGKGSLLVNHGTVKDC